MLAIRKGCRRPTCWGGAGGRTPPHTMGLGGGVLPGRKLKQSPWAAWLHWISMDRLGYDFCLIFDIIVAHCFSDSSTQLTAVPISTRIEICLPAGSANITPAALGAPQPGWVGD